MHLLDNVIILRRVAKPIALFCTDKSPKHCLIQINMKRLHQDLELNIYRNIYHSGDISSIMIQIQIHAERVFWLLLPEVNKMFPKNQFVAQDQQARHLSVCPQ